MKKPIASLKVIPTEETLAIGNKPENNRGSVGIIKMLKVKDLSIAKYQKPLNIIRVGEIIRKFNINRMRPIDVSYRDGEYWIFDGQHRANAYMQLGFTEIPAIIHYGLTYEDEAWLFAHQQDEVGSVNSNHKWNALKEAKDADVLDIVRLCREWGFTVLEKNNKGNNIKCVKSLKDFYNEFGRAKLGTILMCIANAWDYAEHSTDVAIIGGIAKLVRTYPEFDYNRLTLILSRTQPRFILRDMEDKHHAVRGEARRAAYQIADMYNSKLKDKNRKLDTKLLDR